jgi:WD40 repeat protein
MSTGAVIKRFVVEAPITACTFVDSQHVAIGEAFGALSVLGFAQDEKLALEHNSPNLALAERSTEVTSIAASPSGKELVSAKADGGLTTFRLPEMIGGKYFLAAADGQGALGKLESMPIVVGYGSAAERFALGERQLLIWRGPTFEKSRLDRPVTAAHRMRGERWLLAFQGRNLGLELADRSLRPLTQYKSELKGITSLAVSYDSARFAAADGTERIEVFDASSSEHQCAFSGDELLVSLAVDPEFRWLAAGSAGGAVLLLDPSTCEIPDRKASSLPPRLSTDVVAITALATHANTIVAGDAAGGLSFWSARDLTQRRSMDLSNAPISAISRCGD